MTPLKITDHIQGAKDRLRQMFKGQPGMEGLLDLVDTEIQTLEEVFFDLMEKRSLYVAEGTVLDGWGVILNTSRNGLSDTEFRLVLLGQVAVNVSRGTPEDLINVFKLFTRPLYVSLLEVYPANLQLTTVGGDPIGSIADIKSAVRRAAPAGVSIDLFTTATGVPFVFDGDPDPNGLGFADLNDPTLGGYLVSIF